MGYDSRSGSAEGEIGEAGDRAGEIHQTAARTEIPGEEKGVEAGAKVSDALTPGSGTKGTG